MDHISVPVSDIAASTTFYTAALAPLGWACTGFRDGRFAAFKKPGSPALYINIATPRARVHLAFKASSGTAVREFHAAALAAGGRDNGSPDPRPDYGPTYYAAFVLDPDGHNVEAVVGGVG